MDWVKTLKELVLALSAYVRAHHAAGPAWNPAGRPLSQWKGAAFLSTSAISFLLE